MNDKLYVYLWSKGERARAKELAAEISKKMKDLQRELQPKVTRKVAEDFRDSLGPLNALTEASLAPMSKLLWKYQ